MKVSCRLEIFGNFARRDSFPGSVLLKVIEILVRRGDATAGAGACEMGLSEGRVRQLVMHFPNIFIWGHRGGEWNLFFIKIIFARKRRHARVRLRVTVDILIRGINIYT